MTTVYDQSGAMAGSDDGDGDNNLNMRFVFKNGSLSSATGTQVRVTLLFGASCPTESSAIDDVWIGRAAAAGHAYDFTGNQVQLTFSGGNTVSSAAGGVRTSDFVTLGEAFDNTKNYVIAFHNTNGSSNSQGFVGIVNIDMYYDNGASTTASTTAPTLGNTIANLDQMISKIEIQAASTGIPNKVYETNVAVKRAAHY